MSNDRPINRIGEALDTDEQFGISRSYREAASAYSLDEDVSQKHFEDGTNDRLRKLRPARNQPCPCGSGKKYKRCCRPTPRGPVDEAYRSDRIPKRTRLETERQDNG